MWEFESIYYWMLPIQKSTKIISSINHHSYQRFRCSLQILSRHVWKMSAIEIGEKYSISSQLTARWTIMTSSIYRWPQKLSACISFIFSEQFEHFIQLILWLFQSTAEKLVKLFEKHFECFNWVTQSAKYSKITQN